MWEMAGVGMVVASIVLEQTVGTVPYQDWYYNPTFEAVRPPLCCLAERILGTHGMHVLCMYLYFQVKPKGCFIGFKQCFPDSGMHK